MSKTRFHHQQHLKEPGLERSQGHLVCEPFLPQDQCPEVKRLTLSLEHL